MHDCSQLDHHTKPSDYWHVLILVNAHQVEPVHHLGARLKKFHLSVPKGPKKPLVSDIAHAVQSKLGLPLLQQYRLDNYVIGFWGPPVVVE